ncbi:HAD family phosphatase [Ruficoccus amylovorans]|uniref:HAD family phosphatase n=1 Tax=Ruficoccus amylovorans TaxID=1804625 RepID=A0A842HDS8_9BACT|nr:HAD family phosphatase [Ruficoccus amylovorans]MBC2594592.1 HAD family phosphatase [Ruficoccus amylovorans]
MLKIPPGDFLGAIFDCDGTLADSMPVHYRAWVEAFKAHHAKFDFTWEIFYSMAGTGLEDSVVQLNQRFNDTLDPAAAVRSQMEILDRLHHEVTPIVEVVEIARHYAQAGKKVSVSSGGTYRHVHETLRQIGVHDLFPVIITREDYARSKPAPDCFLLAAERMGVPPSACLVFEDSHLGIAAADAAGMASVYVEPETYSRGSGI